MKPDTLGLRGGTVRIFGEAFAEGVSVLIGGLPAPVVFKGEDCLEVDRPDRRARPVELSSPIQMASRRSCPASSGSPKAR